MRELLEVLFADLQENEFIELRLKPIDTGQTAVYLADSVERAIEIASLATDAHHVWFGVAPRYQASGVVRRVTALWIDVDAKSFKDDLQKAMRVASESLAFKPTCLVATGGGYHAYWLLTDPTNPAAARKALESLRNTTETDNVIDATRFLRLPNTVNPKYKPPRPCELLYIEPELTYSIADLLAITRIEPQVLRRIVTGDAADFPSRSERDWNVIRAMQIAGVSEDGIKQVFETRPVGDKYTTEKSKIHYFKRTMARAAESVERAVQRQEQPEQVFEEKEDGYWLRGKTPKRLSTFVFRPSRLLSTPDGDVFSGDIVANGQVWTNVQLPRNAFDRAHNMLKHLTSAHWQWLGTDAQVRQLLPFVLDRFHQLGGTHATAVTSLGRFDDYWITTNGMITRSGFVPSDSAQIVFLDQKRKHHKLRYDDGKAAVVDIAQAFARLYPQTNKLGVTLPLIGWVGAAFIKPVIEQANYRMPNLGIWGTKGGGKSSTIQLLSRLFGVIDPAAVNCRTTPFVLLSMLASSTSIPIHLGEFRADMPDPQLKGLRTWLLMSYDSGFDARGKPDQSVVDYQLSAPMILDGEDLFEDPAVRERTIAVGMSPEQIVEGGEAWLASMELSEYPLELLALPLVQYSLGVDVDWVIDTTNEMHARTFQAFPAQLPGRVRRNIAVCLTGWQMVCDFFSVQDIDFPVPYPAAFQECIGEIVNIETGRTTTQVDEMVIDLVHHAADGKQQFRWKYEAQLNILWVNLATAIAWWYGHRRRTGQAIIGTAAIKRQLRERLATEHPGRGQYVSDIKSVRIDNTTMHAYGISLDALVDAGMDVPETIDTTTVIVKLKGEES